MKFFSSPDRELLEEKLPNFPEIPVSLIIRLPRGEELTFTPTEKKPIPVPYIRHETIPIPEIKPFVFHEAVQEEVKEEVFIPEIRVPKATRITTLRNIQSQACTYTFNKVEFTDEITPPFYVRASTVPVKLEEFYGQYGVYINSTALQTLPGMPALLEEVEAYLLANGCKHKDRTFFALVATEHPRVVTVKLNNKFTDIETGPVNLDTVAYTLTVKLENQFGVRR